MGQIGIVVAALGVLLFSIVTVNGQQHDCYDSEWTNLEPKCDDRGGDLIYVARNTTSGQQSWPCCLRGSVGANTMRIRANGCQVTKCLPSDQVDPCEVGLEMEYWHEGKKITHHDVKRESCNMENESKATAVYCCQKGSLETSLFTTLGAEPHEFPHMALVLTLLECGGTIYNKRHIVTAAHCIVHPHTNMLLVPDERWLVKLGRNIGGVSMPENDYKIVEAIPHPKYSRMNPNVKPEEPFFNDIAILKVDRDIEFGRNVKSLQIAPDDFDELKYANEAVIVGWGTTDTLDLSDHLQKANVIIRSDETCLINKTSAWPEFSKYAPQYLCVGGVWDGKWSLTASKGDSGGPAICRDANGYGVLCGVTSFGPSACLTNNLEQYEKECLPGIYTEVDYFRDWILETAGPQDETNFHKKQLYGEVVDWTEHAHQVRITPSPGKPCGGTLIASDIVVTAAHCINGSEYENVKVWVNLHDVSGLRAYPVKNFAVMPNFHVFGPGPSLEYIKNQTTRVTYTDQLFKNDLALLKLSGKVGLNEFPRLPGADDDFSGDAVEFAFSRETTKDGKMRKREFTILEQDECQRRMDRLEKIKMNFKVGPGTLCGIEKFSGGSKCDRELGGGLISKGTDGKDVLCGVQKFRMCESALPSTFQNMALASNWVKSTMEQM